jgi:hypothetical protein
MNQMGVGTAYFEWGSEQLILYEISCSDPNSNPTLPAKTALAASAHQ